MNAALQGGCTPKVPDGAASYTLAIAAKRERGVRAGIFPPLSDDERRQADEGPKPWGDLDCVRGRP